MYVEFFTVLVILWFLGSYIYNFHLASKECERRARKYNKVMEALVEELGYAKSSRFFDEHSIFPFMEAGVKKGKWGIRLGW
ncbi:hypothetical protein [Pseudomonas sp. AN3A02]|uniref:hypothetical protein n=1 Tax=unclassified Pseudomonas TaxID=196821 RepID=UPI0014310297|nr:hypothetical protein [Pseudomonas sp. AN3A02]NIL20101.1 hypothetical protein [Pseudomonas sp. AN3A02]